MSFQTLFIQDNTNVMLGFLISPPLVKIMLEAKNAPASMGDL